MRIKIQIFLCKIIVSELLSVIKTYKSSYKTKTANLAPMEAISFLLFFQQEKDIVNSGTNWSFEK
jgi:hypothetical protein